MGKVFVRKAPKPIRKKQVRQRWGGLFSRVQLSFLHLPYHTYTEFLTTQTIVLLLVLVGFGVIGFLDDFIIVVQKKNHGLTSLQKLIGQIIVAVAAFFLLKVRTFRYYGCVAIY